MKLLSNILVLFRDRKKLLPQGEQWRKLLLQISDIVENYILIFYNKLTKGRQISSQLTAHSSQLTAITMLYATRTITTAIGVFTPQYSSSICVMNLSRRNLENPDEETIISKKQKISDVCV